MAVKKIVAPKLNSFGTYISTKGYKKSAQVVGTTESTNGKVEEGTVNLRVTKFDGSAESGRVGIPVLVGAVAEDTRGVFIAD